MSDSLIVASPEGPSQQLMLLLHGAGADARQLLPLGRLLAAEFPAAFIVSLAAPLPSEAGSGREWFEVQGLDDGNRVARAEAAIAALATAVAHWQQQAGVGIDAVALIGFAQGGTMALESTRGRPAIAGRVVSIAGPFVTLPQQANPATTLHLFHGKAEPVIPYGFTVEAAQHLVRIGADLTADVIPHVGHQVAPDIAEVLIERLRGHLPRRIWEAAMRAARASQGDGSGQD